MGLIVFSGLPGTGKSALAEEVGRRLQIPVFAKDWIEATLLLCELSAKNPDRPLGSAAYELLTMLAERELRLGQSAILDSVTATTSIRSTWRKLAANHSTSWRVIECVCSDQAVHRSRLGLRQRKIPGWHELTWLDVEKVISYYVPWEEERLVLDAVQPFDENLASLLNYLGEGEL